MLQKQPPEVFCKERCSVKKGVLKIFFKFPKRIQHRCFAVNNATFLRTSIFENICGTLLLVFYKNRNARPKFPSYTKSGKKITR